MRGLVTGTFRKHLVESLAPFGIGKLWNLWTLAGEPRKLLLQTVALLLLNLVSTNLWHHLALGTFVISLINGNALAGPAPLCSWQL